MDRIRAGLTGLGAVFLVTAAAALLFGPEPGDRAAIEQSKAPGEPLAQLGVAPSNEKSDDPARTAAQPAPVAEARPSSAQQSAGNPVNGPAPSGSATPGQTSASATTRDGPVRI
jgi:hypothetical protein